MYGDWGCVYHSSMQARGELSLYHIYEPAADLATRATRGVHVVQVGGWTPRCCPGPLRRTRQPWHARTSATHRVWSACCVVGSLVVPGAALFDLPRQYDLARESGRARAPGMRALVLLVCTAPMTRSTVPALQCDLANTENVCPPAGFFCPAAPPDADKTPVDGSFAGCAPCKCSGDCTCGSGCKLCSCGQLCCTHSPAKAGNPCYQPCPPGQTSKGDGTDWDQCYTPLTRQWGVQWLMLATIVAAGYVGGGAAWAKRTGSALRHPHEGRWREMHGFVLDGIAFTRARVQGRRGSVTELLRGGSRERSDGEAMERGTSGRERPAREKSPRAKKKSNTTKGRQSERADASPAPVVALEQGTPAGGGGRWVHVT